MIIDQLNTELTGGASVAACRLHRALTDLGVTSRVWCARLPDQFQEPGIYRLPRGSGGTSLTARAAAGVKYLLRKLQWRIDKRRYLRGRPSSLEAFSVPWLPWDTVFDQRHLSGDVLHLHWVTKFLDLPSFFATVPNEHPVVWTLHDMCPFTGGCHHADGCEEFTAGCHHCPQLMRPHAHDLAQRAFAVKIGAVANKNLHVVTPSRWMERLVRRSRVFAAARSVETIYNGLDLRQFAPHNKAVARRQLQLPDDQLVLGFAATWLPNRRKGFVEFAAAASRLSSQRRVLALIVGEGDFPAEATIAFPFKRLGFLKTPDQLSTFYSASDVFVLSSLGENLAQTGVESLACRTPVVAFDVGGLSEYVRPGETGLLVSRGSIDELTRQLNWLLDRPSLGSAMGIAGRRLVEHEFDHRRQAHQYLKLYDRVVSGGRRARAA